MRSCFLSFALFAALLAVPSAGAGQDELSRLRSDYARDFTDPLVHLRLAKFHRDAGRGLLAFDIVESLRRQAPEAFRQGFSAVFADSVVDFDDATLEALVAEHAGRPDDVDLIEHVGLVLLARGEFDRAGEFFLLASDLEPNERRHVENMAEALNRQGHVRRASELLAAWDRQHDYRSGERALAVQEALDAGRLDEAKRLVKAALADDPESCELSLQRGQVYAAEGKPAEAERFLLHALQACPERARLHGSLGSFAMLVKGRPVEALDHYLNAYFRDPNYHDGSYVDARIRALSSSLAEALVQQQRGDCATTACLAKLLSHDNPAVLRLALTRAESAWGPELERPLLALLGHDDPDLRAGAMLLLARNAGEAFSQRLTALFGSRDPRRLGMAAQLAVRLEGRAGRARAKALLDHADEFVRFEAITALALEGGPSGRQLVSAHFEVETSPRLRELALRLGGEGS